MKMSVAAVLMAVTGVLASSAAAQAPTQDSVRGSAGTGFGMGFALYTFDVRSGPSGENPTGTVTIDSFFGVIGPLDATCLSVSANKAAMIFRAPEPTSAVAGLAIAVQDDGPGQDRIDFHTVAALPNDCPVPGEVSAPTISGDITITDAQPLPTATRQCKHGGWRSFGVFKNQGDCVSFVRHQARQECIYIRAAHGRPAFRAQYGHGIHKRHAMRRCIRERMND
jgi:hypothetical protein